MITKEKLQAMSDFEVNKALANKLSVFWHAAPAITKSNSWEYAPHYAECKTEDGEVAVSLPDYCNTPNDIIPLAFEHGIDYVKLECAAFYGLIDTSVGFCYEVFYKDISPLRAIACCLILVLQENQK